MKIIQEGNLYLNWTSERITCAHCKCVLEAEEADLHWTYQEHPASTHPMHDTVTDEVWVQCSMCKHRIVLGTSAVLPVPVLDRLKKKEQSRLKKWPELSAWLTKHEAKLMWCDQSLTSSRLGPTQVDCWAINGAYAMIFYWPTSYSLYTALHPALHDRRDFLHDAEARLRIDLYD